MAITNQISNQLQRKTEKPKFSVTLKSAGYQTIINDTFRDPKRANRFIANIMSAVSNNPALNDCDPKTVLNAGLLGETLNLCPSPQLGHFHIIPFENRKAKTKVATFVLGYKGYIQLALKSGFYKKLNVAEVREGELNSYDVFEETFSFKQIQNPLERAKAKVVGYMGRFVYLNGFEKTIYIDKVTMEEHAKKYSPAYNYDLKYGTSNSYWTTQFDDMAKKTVIRRLLSQWGMLSTELQEAIIKDNAVINSDGSVDYVDIADDIDVTSEKTINSVDELPTAPLAEEEQKETIKATAEKVKEPKEEKTSFMDESKIPFDDKDFNF